jgi:hypothetical protein
MKPLPEDEPAKTRVSLTERIARIGVITFMLAIFVALFIYGFGECERYYEGYNDVLIDEERKWKP